MPRKPLQRSNTLPYHVTARVNNREDFHLGPDRMWKLLGSECLALRLVYGVEFHALVMMPNHIHMLLTVPHEDLGIVMNVFMSQVTRTSNLLSGRSGHLFGGPYHGSIVNSSRYFGHALKYVYRNPVRGGLCNRVEDYRFSTLQGLLGEAHLPLPIHYTRVGMELALPSCEPLEQLDWLNRPLPKEAEELIRKNLRKRIFDRVICGKTRKPHPILEQLI